MAELVFWLLMYIFGTLVFTLIFKFLCQFWYGPLTQDKYSETAMFIFAWPLTLLLIGTVLPFIWLYALCKFIFYYGTKSVGKK